MRRYRLASPPPEAELGNLREALEDRGWVETHGDDWDLLWSAPIPDRATYLALGGRLVNHLPGSLTLHHKDELAHFAAPAADGRPCVPDTFSMPGDEPAWRAAAATDPDAIWIVKPKRGAMGEGISLRRGAGGAVPDARHVVQRYIADPMLLPGRPGKHSLRVYVLVTSLEPLRAFVYPDGPVKFASRPFDTGDAALDDLVVHLTNPRVQRTNTAVADPVRTVDVTEYGRLLATGGHDPHRLLADVRDVIARTLRAHREPMLRVSRYVAPDLAGCFELLGFDVVVDAAPRPWIVECNVGPAIAARGEPGSAAQAAQSRIKRALVSDTIGLVTAGEPGAYEVLV